MEFFKSLAEVATEKLQLGIAITVDKEQVIVTVTPKPTGGTGWPPFVMKGDAGELDSEWEKQIGTFREGVGVIANAETYLDSIKKAAADKQQTAAKKTIADKKKDEAQEKIADKFKDKKEDKKKEEKKKDEPKKKEPEKEESEGLELFE